MEQSSKIQGQVDNLWTKVLVNAGKLPVLLGDISDEVKKLETHLSDPLDKLLRTFRIDEKILTVPSSLHTINIQVKNLYKAIENLDVYDAYSILEVVHEVLDLLKNTLPQLLNIDEAGMTKLEETLDTFEELVTDIVDLFALGYDDAEHSLVEWTELVKKTVQNFTDQLNQLGVSTDTTQRINSAVVPFLNIIIIAAAQETQPEDIEKKDPNEYHYERELAPETERVIRNVNKNFNEIYAEIGQIPLVNEVKPEEKDLKDVWDFSIKRMRSLDPEAYDDVEGAFDNLRENIDDTFDFVIDKYLQNRPELANILNTTIRPHIIEWLTLPDDFRPNNWVEIIHVVVQNIQFSLKTSFSTSDSVQQWVLPFINKLEYILSQVDNDHFKLLIIPKEEPEIHKIYLPDILEPEEPETDKDKLWVVTDVKDVSEKPMEVVNTEGGNTSDSENEPKLELEKLTVESIIDFLCFDKTSGATVAMESELADVIRDLYYREWFSNRIAYLEDELMDLLDTDKYLAIWEDIKAELLAEKGINIGKFIQSLIDKLVAEVNKLIDFIKDTTHYIIDELFKLVKAIIDFFKEVNLPLAARGLLKQLPPFKEMPNTVTLLHIIAAIPYTLYQEFVNLKIPAPQTV
jgi:hypothetical protein